MKKNQLDYPAGNFFSQLQKLCPSFCFLYQAHLFCHSLLPWPFSPSPPSCPLALSPTCKKIKKYFEGEINLPGFKKRSHLVDLLTPVHPWLSSLVPANPPPFNSNLLHSQGFLGCCAGKQGGHLHQLRWDSQSRAWQSREQYLEKSLGQLSIIFWWAYISIG